MLLEHDLQSIKTEAIIAGISYKDLIGSILHQYVQGKLDAKVISEKGCTQVTRFNSPRRLRKKHDNVFSK